MKKLFALLGLTTAAFVAAAHAQTLLTWDVSGTGNPSVATLSSSSNAANLSTISGLNTLSRTGLTASQAGNSFASTGWSTNSAFNDADDYVSFSLQASSGFEATFTSLNFVVNGSNTAPNTGRWGYKIGAGSFTLQDPFTLTFALPGSAVTWDFADFTTTETVEFRWWVYGATSINGIASATTGSARIGNIAGNDLVLNGSVALVPEPSSLALVGLAGVGFAGYVLRRRRRA
jgi:hypothetical protein